MEFNFLHLKYRLRKTDELVEVIEHNTMEKGARNPMDWVSYIDSEGGEHIKEPLTLEWDFTIDDPYAKGVIESLNDIPKTVDVWETRRYDMVKTMAIDKGFTIDNALEVADDIIRHLKPETDETQES